MVQPDQAVQKVNIIIFVILSTAGEFAFLRLFVYLIHLYTPILDSLKQILMDDVIAAIANQRRVSAPADCPDISARL